MADSSRPRVRPMLAYRFLRFLLRLAVRAFFRRVEVVGLRHVPPPGGGPVVFAGNHPNSLLDPVAITVSCGRIVHFAAKDVLFKSAVLRVFLRAMGAVPIRRRADHAEGALDNQGAFDALFDVLAGGGCMGIFPEGLSHDSTQLARLKTGAARIALGADARHPGLGVRIVPCGLTYTHAHRFRSSLLVQFGPPLEVADAERAHYEASPADAARALTDRLEAGLRALTVNAPDWDTLRVLDGVRRLYQPPRISLEARVELARRFNREYPRVKDDPEVVALTGRVRAYLDRLDAFGLADRDVQRELGPGEVAGRVVGHLMLLTVWLPLALVGLLIHGPMGLLIGWVGRNFAPRRDVVATTKFLVGFLLLNAVYLALTAYIWLHWGWAWAVATLLLGPLSGYALIHVLHRAGAVSRLFGTTVGMLLLPREVAALRAEREALEAAIIAAVERYKPDDLELLFPPSEREPREAATP